MGGVSLSHLKLSSILRKRSIFSSPFYQCNANPKRVYAQSDYAKQPPYYPIAKQAYRRAVELQSTPFYHGMIGFPASNHTPSPRSANAECERCYKRANYNPTDKLK